MTAIDAAPEQDAPLDINIAVCDDDAADREQLARLTAELLAELGARCRITAFESAAPLLSAIGNGASFHLLLLDVMMAETDGITLAATLRAQGERTAIVFVSSNRELAMYGYEVSAARYLVKPLKREKLREALEFCCQEYLAKREILLPAQKGRNRIVLSELIFAEAQEREIRLCLIGRETAASMRFSDLLALLPSPQFLQIHRSYVVNLSFVQSVELRELRLKDGRLLPISKYRFENVRRLWANYLNR